jgi:hypothetical protein
MRWEGFAGSGFQREGCPPFGGGLQGGSHALAPRVEGARTSPPASWSFRGRLLARVARVFTGGARRQTGGYGQVFVAQRADKHPVRNENSNLPSAA